MATRQSRQRQYPHYSKTNDYSSDNAKERPPQYPANSSWLTRSQMRFVLLCMLWYSSSALSSNTGKMILIQFRFPVTLTFVQFFFVAGYCLLFAKLSTSPIRTPTLSILKSTVPMAIFQVLGHIFASIAISRVPVSTVHTIKALSPLFTVLAYALLFRVSYSINTYVSLLPLTLGVMLACSFDVSASSPLGLACSFGSALVFVSQNIFFKKIMPTESKSDAKGHGITKGRVSKVQKLDKLNLLFYSSGMAFVLMVPLWAFSDAPTLFTSSRQSTPPPSSSILIYFIANGTVHFAQNILAFNILSSTSPVTYSIASLVKRVAVILFAILQFKQSLHPLQAVGIACTAGGLWMYNKAQREKGDVDKGERQRRGKELRNQGVLPIDVEESEIMRGSNSQPIIAPIPLGPLHYNPPLRIPADSFFESTHPAPSKPGFVYPSPPHSPPATTAPSYHPTQIQYRRGTIGKSHPPPPPMSKPISVL